MEFLWGPSRLPVRCWKEMSLTKHPPVRTPRVLLALSSALSHDAATAVPGERLKLYSKPSLGLSAL